MLKRMLMLGTCAGTLLISSIVAGGAAGASVPPACTTQAVAVIAGQQSFVAVRTAIQNDRRAIVATRAQMISDQRAGDTVAVSEDAVALTAARGQLAADRRARRRTLQNLHFERRQLRSCKRLVQHAHGLSRARAAG